MAPSTRSPTRTGSGPRGCATSSTASSPADPTISRPEHAYHALEIMLAAQAAGRDGIAREIESDFPDPVYSEEWLGPEHDRYAHDRRSHDGL